MGETTHQVVGEMTQGRRAKRLTQWRAKRLGGETTQGETTQGERESGRNDPLPLIIARNTAFYAIININTLSFQR